MPVSSPACLRGAGLGARHKDRSQTGKTAATAVKTAAGRRPRACLNPFLVPGTGTRLVLVRVGADPSGPRLAVPLQSDPRKQLTHDSVGDECGDVGRAGRGRYPLDNCGAATLTAL